MHKVAKEIMDRIKSKINSCGVDGITEHELIEMKYWSCVADAMTSYDYHYKIIEEMEKPENEYGENYDYRGKYYTPMHENRGRRYMMTPEDYREHEPEYYRDMDRRKGVMYYTESMPNHNGNMNMGSSRYDSAKRGYEESKANHPNDDPNNMKAIETIFTVLEGDMQELKPKMTTNERNMAKNKLTGLANML